MKKHAEYEVYIPQLSAILNEAESKLGKIIDLQAVSGGLVHYVFKLIGESETAYLKIRSNHYSGIPNIPTDPALIANEKRAIDLFTMNSADYFPKVLLYNSALHYLLLSDVMPEGTTLDKQYKSVSAPDDAFVHMGNALASIHSNTTTQEPVREPDDKQYQANLMKYALESYEHHQLMQAAAEHKAREKQLLVGDLSPKNTYIRDGIVRLCDLENAHQGALQYDQAFIIAHLLLHQEVQPMAIAAMWSFIDGYEESGKKIDQGDALLSQTLHGVLLYRLINPVIPYDLSFSKIRRKQMAANVFSSLDQLPKDLEVVVANLFKE